MCEVCDDAGGGLSRRTLLAAGAAVASLAAVATLAPSPVCAAVEPFPVAPNLQILPRHSWGADLAPKGAFQTETVKFLLVHHTASSNVRPRGGWRDVIRQAYAWQTSPAKGWPDVCYHWFIDPDGVVYEGREGSLVEARRADATGGNQGYAQLVCLIGDFTNQLPTPAAHDALVRTLAWLADRYSISTRPGAMATFVSRGSNRFAAGTTVTTPTIAPHRAMTFTACPGNRFAPVVSTDLQAQVHAVRRPRVANVQRYR